MIILALLAKVAGHIMRRFQQMPDTKKNILTIGALLAATVIMQFVALFISGRLLFEVLSGKEPLTRVDVFLISLFTLTTFQLAWALWFGEAVRSRVAWMFKQ